ncbi:hypothetical protein ACO0LO_01780 [Undibacterium sp. TJN25]|uniref:hypothetical protein n=1 Tax=Undibacterium sp. TJN25 TaxID=3413056 RepID=UPI003BF2ED26
MNNLLSKPRKWKNKAVMFKLETAYGVDATPTGAVNWIEARNVSLTPMDNDKAERNIEMPYMGSSGSVLVSSWAKLSFDVALATSGSAGVAPKWGPLLLACGTAETITATTSVAYNLVSVDQLSVSAYINIDGVLHKLFGVRGSVKGNMAAKGTGKMSFSFDANYLTPIAQDMPTVIRTGWQIEEGINSKNTGPASIGGVDLAFSTFDWDFGNKIARNDLPGPQREVSITDRTPTAGITVLAPSLDVFNPFLLAETSAVVPLSCTHGSAAGKQIQTDLQTRITNVEYDNIDGLLAYKLTLEPLPVDGNDEIALTLL